MAHDDYQHEHDVEYGPNPPGATYEHSDIDPAIGYKFALWLAVAMLVSAGIVYGFFWFFLSSEVARDARVQQFPLAAGAVREPPTPRLQTQPFKDVYLLKQGEAAKLESYAWVDKEGGVVRIPIDRAMELTVEHGLPARAGSSNDFGRVVLDGAGGRTMGVR
jgi:hypothetical protein